MKKRHVVTAATLAALVFTTVAPGVAFADDLQDQIDEKAAELEEVIEDYNAAKEDLKDTEDQIEAIEEALPELEEGAEIVARIAVDEYQRGRMSTATSLMAGSPDQALARVSILGALRASQDSDIAQYGSTAADLQNKLDELDELKADQKDIKSDLKDKKSDIEAEVADLEAQQQQAGGGGNNWTGSLPPVPSGMAGAVVQFAYDQIGDPYYYGHAGPDSWDCSGLTMVAWAQAGISLSHQTNAQWNETARISRDELVPGDLVFYNGLNHVAIYVDDNTIVHAPQAGQPVQAASIDSMAIDGYGRPY